MQRRLVAIVLTLLAGITGIHAQRGANEIRTTDNAFEEAARIAPEDLNDHSRGFSGWLDPIQHHPGPTLSASGYNFNQGC